MIKRCSTCRLEKPLSEFHRHRGPRGDGYQYHCKDCARASARASYERHAEKWRIRIAEYAMANPEWRRLQRRKNQAARRARKRGSQVGPVNLLEILGRDGPTCHICKAVIDLHTPDPMSLAFDHVIPLARGGDHCSSNIRPSHRHCNGRKGASF